MFPRTKFKRQPCSLYRNQSGSFINRDCSLYIYEFSTDRHEWAHLLKSSEWRAHLSERRFGSSWEMEKKMDERNGFEVTDGRTCHQQQLKFVLSALPSSHVLHLNILWMTFFEKGEKEKREKKRTVLNQHVTTLSNEFSLVYLLHCYSNSFLLRARIDYFFFLTACFRCFLLLFIFCLLGSCLVGSYLCLSYSFLFPYLFSFFFIFFTVLSETTT